MSFCVLFLIVLIIIDIHTPGVVKRKEEPIQHDHMPNQKKPRLVFTDLQRRTLQAIFKVSCIFHTYLDRK